MDALEVFQSFEKVMNWAGERNKLSVDYGVQPKLCMSEIHIIDMIGQQPGILQMQLCEKTGLTKGRISVIVSNLIKKNMVIKKPDGFNKKEIPLVLSEIGKIAYQCHRERDQQVFIKMQEIMSRYTQEELEHFNEALQLTLAALQESVQ